MARLTRCLVFVVMALLPAACVPPARTGQQVLNTTATAASAAAYQTAVPQPTAPPAPTVAALPPASPAPTVTYDPAAPTPEPQLNWELVQATASARATAEPFPTADPPQIVAGAPASASARRGGLELELRLDHSRMVAGGSARAELLLRNTGGEPLISSGELTLFQLHLTDDLGQTLQAWPWAQVALPGGHFVSSLAPGASVSGSQIFYVPADRAGQPTELWATLRFSRAQPGSTEAPDNIWLELEAGPIVLEVLQPGPEQQLQAELQVDRQGWRLQVRDAQGRVPEGPFMGQFEAFASGGATRTELRHNQQGLWLETWEDWPSPDPAPAELALLARAWVGAPGYGAAVTSVTLEGQGDPLRGLGLGEPPRRERFADPALAQLALDMPLYRPGSLPAGARQADLRVTTWSFETGDATLLLQPYQLADGRWMALRQLVGRAPGDGWDGARYMPQARQVRVGQAEGYLATRFGRWLLSWQLGPVGFELQAPLASLTEEQLLTIAASVKP